MVALLDGLPQDVVGICQIAQQQTIHHNLLSYFGIPPAVWSQMRRVRPPRARDVLQALAEMAPYNLYDERLPGLRVVGACVLESHLLACLLRARGIPVRVRAGYFKDTRVNGEHVVRFWEQVARAKGEAQAREEIIELADLQPAGAAAVDEPLQQNEQIEEAKAWTHRQNAVNHAIEHWICEYWDGEQQAWRLLDANPTFLKAHGDIDVGFHLPRRHFEYAHEAWTRMRSSPTYESDQHAEDPQDGRSHIRSQLLCDFYSLLHHDVLGIAEPSEEVWPWLKQTTYKQLTADELRELDLLADLLARDPSVDELVALYAATPTLHCHSAEADPDSFLFAA
jgi:hypothetical protein